jgi:predicted porin
VSAFAQTEVKITGLFDVGYRSTSVGNANEKTQKVITNNNAGTSQVDFVITEDLGAGLKAIAYGEADFHSVKPSLGNASTTNNGYWYTGAFFNSEVYVGLTSATAGTLKLGAPNSEFLLGNAKIQPFGTALGGGYSNTFGRMGTNSNVGINGFMGAGETARVVRNERTVKYDSPVFNGAQIVLEWSPGNSLGTGTTSTSTTTGTSYASNNNAWSATTLNYGNGPLNLTYSTGQISAGANLSSGFYAPGSTTVASGLAANKLTANGSVTYTMYGGNYAINSALTGYVGFTTTKSSNQTQAAAATDVEDSKSSNFALKYVVGQTDFLFNRVQRQSNMATDTVGTPNGASSLTGLGVNYNLSKMTSVYGRYEKASNVVAIPGTATATSANTSYGAQTITALGMMVKF